MPANRAEQDLKYSTGDANVPVEVRTQPLGDRKHPLPCRNVRQHVVGEVGGDLAHAPGVAGVRRNEPRRYADGRGSGWAENPRLAGRTRELQRSKSSGKDWCVFAEGVVIVGSILLAFGTKEG